MGTNGEKDRSAAAEDAAWSNTTKKDMTITVCVCVCVCVCGSEAPWISELQSEIEKFKPSHGFVPSNVPLIRRHHPVRAFKPPPPQNVQRDRGPTSALWTTQRRTQQSHQEIKQQANFLILIKAQRQKHNSNAFLNTEQWVFKLATNSILKLFCLCSVWFF